MSNQDHANSTSLVPTAGSDLAPLAPANPLVSRGMADLANLPTEAESNSSQSKLKNKHLFTEALRSIAEHYIHLGRMKAARQHRLRAQKPQNEPGSQPLDESGNPVPVQSKGRGVTPEMVPGVPANQAESQGPGSQGQESPAEPQDNEED